MRQSLVIGNWKMNGTRASVELLAQGIMAGLGDNTAGIAVCAPYVYLPSIGEIINGSRLALGAQNVADKASGAYTGEVSAAMLAEFGCQYALVGHSERRSYYGDTDASVAARFCQAQSQNIIPVLCIGETLEQREQEQTFAVVDGQLDAVIELAGIAAFNNAVIAYEPVWAIGTGKTASDEQAQEVHQHIRQYIAAKDQTIAEKIQILYGGSAKPDNAKGLFAMPDIDGGLIGGASLDAESFLKIYHSV
ncbi:triose-phosphate isomerase [Methylovulum psychrotolerans]|uniref:Triosephosphate isomerase n=1 Tax=Methylovulum psychrotolerans TaxID=1704499 RepID=A0A1Z4C0W3_9GAMM|nr:triose-phosphate isomerase [Methylovulum psychrotolerans]ASF47160.1 triose-phosphate isomerase [Methylovulum psychrotolerans]MBT9097203.1 triose-phosphate isomerase [Methylovulum psychrotolerans]POZ51670.1 triose-phosphate isomerase [Methylovulum psychrotolerans]